MPVEFDLCACNSQRGIFGSNSDCAVVYTLFIGITAQTIIAVSDLLENVRVLRVEFDCALEILGRLSPASLPPVDKATQHKRPRFVRQTLLRQSKFFPSAVVIVVTEVQMLG